MNLTKARKRIASTDEKPTNKVHADIEALKKVWVNKAWGLIVKAGYDMHDQGVWVNLHMLHAQGMPVEDAVAKLPELLPRLNNPTPGPWSASFFPGEPIKGMVQPGRRQDEWRIDPPVGDQSNGGCHRGQRPRSKHEKQRSLNRRRAESASRWRGGPGSLGVWRPRLCRP